MIPGTPPSAVVPGTTLTANIIPVWHWYQNLNVNCLTGQIGSRQRVYTRRPKGFRTLRWSKYRREQPLATQRTDPHRTFEAILYIQWPCPTRSGLVVGWSYVEVQGPSSHVSCCCVLCFSIITILRTRRDAAYNTMITLIKTCVSNPSSRATSRHPDNGSTSYLRGRPLYSMALPDTKRVGRELIICRGGRHIVTCIMLLCALFFYDNDTTCTTRCDVD